MAHHSGTLGQIGAAAIPSALIVFAGMQVRAQPAPVRPDVSKDFPPPTSSAAPTRPSDTRRQPSPVRPDLSQGIPAPAAESRSQQAPAAHGPSKAAHSGPAPAEHRAPVAAETDEESTRRNGFGKRARNVIVLESLFGYANETETLRLDNRNSTVETFASEGVGFFPARMVRFGYHYIGGSQITIGSGFGLWDSKQIGPHDNAISFEIRPRVGYALPLSSYFALWPRAGLSFIYRRLGADGTVWALSPGLDLFAVVTPAKHIGIVAGLDFGIGVVGRYRNDSHNFTHDSIGFAVGLLVDF